MGLTYSGSNLIVDLGLCRLVCFDIEEVRMGWELARVRIEDRQGHVIAELTERQALVTAGLVKTWHQDRFASFPALVGKKQWALVVIDSFEQRYYVLRDNAHQACHLQDIDIENETFRTAPVASGKPKVVAFAACQSGDLADFDESSLSN
jgi:hypothetical protein